MADPKPRNKFRVIRDTITDERRREAEKNAFKVLYELTRDYKFIGSYASFQSELSLDKLNQVLLEEGKLLLPRTTQHTMSYYSAQNGQKIGSFGVLEPVEGSKKAVPELILVPGLAFDSYNHRLGYGKGYFDRYLEKNPNAVSIGVCFKEQLTDQLPAEPHDITVFQLRVF